VLKIAMYFSERDFSKDHSCTSFHSGCCVSSVMLHPLSEAAVADILFLDGPLSK
jgi:hypothetical protein